MGGDLLVAAPERWDEACFVVPALRALGASGLGLGVWCRAGQEDFWRTLPELEVLGFPSRTKPRHAAATLHGQWRASLAWEPGFAAETFHRAAIPRRLGPPGGRALRKHLSDPLESLPGPLEHRVRFYLGAVEEMGIDTRQPEFFAPATPGLGAEEGRWLLTPDSDFGPSHEWPLDRWEAVARRLLERGERVGILALAQGRGLGAALAGRLGIPVPHPIEPTALAGALPDLAASRRLLAADGSLPHLAAHVGATCVTLFGPNDPTWKRPLGKRHAIVRRHTECAPCLLASCPLDGRCQRELEVERVWEAVERLLSGAVPVR